VKGFLNVGQGQKFGFKKENKLFHKKVNHEGEWNLKQDISKEKNPNNLKVRVSNPKEIS
jgi:hypothetical protein